jgi:hypothetical protein
MPKTPRTSCRPLRGGSLFRARDNRSTVFYNTLDEQRHLTGVMLGLETDPALRKFLETTRPSWKHAMRKSRRCCIMDRARTGLQTLVKAIAAHPGTEQSWRHNEPAAESRAD